MGFGSKFFNSLFNSRNKNKIVSNTNIVEQKDNIFDKFAYMLEGFFLSPEEKKIVKKQREEAKKHSEMYNQVAGKKDEFNYETSENDSVSLERVESVSQEVNETEQEINYTRERLQELQEKYRTGAITVENMSEEETNALFDLYVNQIKVMKDSNKRRKEELNDYRKKDKKK